MTRAVAEQGYTEPTPIQRQAIPVVLGGHDLLGAAQTGTGKTAGFTLPMLQRLAAGTPQSRPRALVLTPTRELAAQVYDSVRTYGKYLDLRASVMFGGVNIGPQIDDLDAGVDVLVATPGRLLDHVQQGSLDLGGVEILVLDEADRMLDMGFIHDIRRVLALLPVARQNLLFSATFSDEIRELAGSFLKNPRTVEVAPRNATADGVAQVVHPVDGARKRALLSQLVREQDWRQVLVFVRTKHGANRLAEQLRRDGVEAEPIHGNKSQSARTRALKRFKDNELRVLVATDIAARGLDIDALPHVVNFDIPHVAEDYVHRIGRTGRAGEAGEAVSLVSAEERPLLAAIERLIRRRLEERVVPGFEPGTAPAPEAPAEASPGQAAGEPAAGPAGAGTGSGTARRRRRRRRRGAPLDGQAQVAVQAAAPGSTPAPRQKPRAGGNGPTGPGNASGPARSRRGGQSQRSRAGTGARRGGSGQPGQGRGRGRAFDDDERAAQLREHRMRSSREPGDDEPYVPPPQAAQPKPRRPRESVPVLFVRSRLRRATEN